MNEWNWSQFRKVLSLLGFLKQGEMRRGVEVVHFFILLSWVYFYKKLISWAVEMIYINKAELWRINSCCVFVNVFFF